MIFNVFVTMLLDHKLEILEKSNKLSLVDITMGLPKWHGNHNETGNNVCDGIDDDN